MKRIRELLGDEQPSEPDQEVRKSPNPAEASHYPLELSCDTYNLL